MLEIYLYIGAAAMRDQTFLYISDTLPPVASVSVYRSVAQLEGRLRDCRRDQIILLAAPDGSADMRQMSELHDLLNGVNLVFIMPEDIESETIDLAHGLYPRYLCFRPYCFYHLSVVIENICQLAEAKHDHQGFETDATFN